MATSNPSAKLIALPMASWPAAERQAWTAAIGPRPSLFGQAGRANHLRAATAASYANAVGQWLAHLQGHGWLLPHETPAERFQIERLNALMTDMDERGLKPSSMRQILIMIRSAMKFIDPVADFSMLTRPRGSRSARRCQASHAKSSPLTNWSHCRSSSGCTRMPWC